MKGWKLFTSIIVMVAILGQSGTVPLPAQEIVKKKGEMRGKVPEYYISLGTEKSIEEELLMKVNVWGHVSKPGQYMVPSTTDLVSLISFAGGPTENAKLNGIKIIRSNNETQEVIYVDMEKYIDTADPEFVPILMPGDTVIVPGSLRHLVSRTVSFLFQFINIAYFYTLILQRR